MSDERETKPAGHRWFAATYDFLVRGAERRRIGKLRRNLLANVRGDVLEIGAGTGANFEHYPSDARVIATEPDPHMLKRAQGKLRPNIDARLAPAEELPFADASFDTVVSTLVLCTVRDPARALNEARRVLRPGGSLIFLEHVRGEGALARFQKLIQPVYGWFAAGCHLSRDTERAITDAGFRFETITRGKLAPLMPAIYGVGRPA